MDYQPTRSAGFFSSACALIPAPPARPLRAPEMGEAVGRDGFLDPWRNARGEAAQRLLSFTQRTLADHEAANALRALAEKLATKRAQAARRAERRRERLKVEAQGVI